MFYPIYLNLTGRRALVVGGGEVAERKIESLFGTGAIITVISPNVTDRISNLALEKRIEVERRAYKTGDCGAAVLVLCATDDAEVNQMVFNDAHRAGALVNSADQPAFCDFIMPAVVRR